MTASPDREDGLGFPYAVHGAAASIRFHRARSPLIALIRSSECFGISILRREQQDLSANFATPGKGRIPVGNAPVPMSVAITGAPVIGDCLGYFDCLLDQVAEAGDHQIVIGRVVMADRDVGRPLLYFDGNYCGLAAYGSKS